MVMKHSVTLEIAGTKFRLVADADDDHLHRLADIVNQRVDELRNKTSHIPTPSQLLALVALGLADDLLTAEKREAQIGELTRNAVARAIERIDRRIAIDFDSEADPDKE
jgi:cell division protein ZapA (FtsZ GTPase activity inhibitor)